MKTTYMGKNFSLLKCSLCYKVRVSRYKIPDGLLNDVVDFYKFDNSF